MTTQVQKNLKTKVSVFLVGATIALSGAALPASAQVSGSVTVDANQAAEQAAKAVLSLKNRDACVKAAQEAATSAVRQRLNVMVFNLSQNYSRNLQKAVFRQLRCGHADYGLWIFRKGTFINHGDGGYINWSFSGNFKRTGRQGHTVLFSPL